MIKMFTSKNYVKGNSFPKDSNLKPTAQKPLLTLLNGISEIKSFEAKSNSPFNAETVNHFETTTIHPTYNTSAASFNTITCELMKTNLKHITGMARLAMSLVMFITIASASVFGQDIDIALRQTIDNSLPTLGGQIKYNIYLINQGNTTATGITVNSQTPLGAINNVSTIVTGGAASYNAGNGLVAWTVPSLAIGDSIRLEITANRTSQGVYFNIAEIMEYKFSATRTSYNNNMVGLTTQDCDNEVSRLEIPMSKAKDELANNDRKPDGTLKSPSSKPPGNLDSESGSGIGFRNGATCSIRGRVLMQNTNKPIDGVLVTLKNECDATVQTIYTDASGFYEFNVTEGCDYSLDGTKTNLASQGKTVSNLSCINDGVTVDIYMFGTGDIVKIENIYFNYGKYNIRPDAREGIDKLVKLMRQYPGMTIKLGSHTDSQSPSDFNQTLSDGRARESAEYLFKRGISRTRVSYQGYGETKILNGCSDGVKCSEEEHQLNRRTEFQIIKLE